MVLQRLKKHEKLTCELENSNSPKTEKLKELCARQPTPTGSPATTAEAAEANEGGQRLTCNAVNAMLEARCGRERETLASITVCAAFRASVKKNYRRHCCCKFSNPTCNFADSTVELPRESTGLVQMATDTRVIH